MNNRRPLTEEEINKIFDHIVGSQRSKKIIVTV